VQVMIIVIRNWIGSLAYIYNAVC